MWHLTHRGLYHCLMPDYVWRCQTSTLIMVPIIFWQNSDPFKKKNILLICSYNITFMVLLIHLGNEYQSWCIRLLYPRCIIIWYAEILENAIMIIRIHKLHKLVRKNDLKKVMEYLISVQFNMTNFKTIYGVGVIAPPPPLKSIFLIDFGWVWV